MKKLIYFPVARIIVGVVCCLAILLAAKSVKPILHATISSKVIADTIKNYLLALVLLFSYFYLFKFYEKRKITELSIKRLPGELSGGFILGFSMISLIILILYFLGYYSIVAISNAGYLLAPFSLLVTAAVFEEVVFRLIIYRILEEWLGTYRALLLISILFTAPHLFNGNISVLAVATILLFGFGTGIMYTYTRRVWLPFAFHLGWNFAQPFYGSNLSGEEDIGSIIKAKFNGPALFTGGLFGVEASLFSVIFLAIMSVTFLYFSVKKGKMILK